MGPKKDEVSVQWYLKNKEGFGRGKVGRLVLQNKKDRNSWLPEEVEFKVGGTEDGFVFQKVGVKGKAQEDLSDNQRIVLSVLEEFGERGATFSKWKEACREKGVSEDTFKKCRQVLHSKKKLVDKEGDRYFPKKG